MTAVGNTPPRHVAQLEKEPGGETSPEQGAMMPTILVQLLCPDRHCIVAAYSDDKPADELVAQLKAMVTTALGFHVLNPWCGLCGAAADTWSYEAKETPWLSMAEAQPILEAGEAGQIMYARTQRAAGLAYDKEPGAQN
jgi:hypothetical protein